MSLADSQKLLDELDANNEGNASPADTLLQSLDRMQLAPRLIDPRDQMRIAMVDGDATRPVGDHLMQRIKSPDKDDELSVFRRSYTSKESADKDHKAILNNAVRDCVILTPLLVRYAGTDDLFMQYEILETGNVVRVAPGSKRVEMTLDFRAESGAIVPSLCHVTPENSRKMGIAVNALYTMFPRMNTPPIEKPSDLSSLYERALQEVRTQIV